MLIYHLEGATHPHVRIQARERANTGTWGVRPTAGLKTDTAGCLRAIETQSDLMLKATRVDGVYDSDSEINKDAKLFEELTFDEAITNNLKVMDATALTLARDHKLPIKVFNVNQPNALKNIICGKKIGTLIS